MRFILDVNVGRKLTRWLNDNGHDATYVNDVFGASSEPDVSIAALADAEARVVISNDVDFSDGYFVKGQPKRVIHLRTNNITDALLIHIFRTNVEALASVIEAHPSLLIEVFGVNEWVYHTPD